jgi:siroheme synthase (precorrin-2 oxidase/ferrochelatase)
MNFPSIVVNIVEVLGGLTAIGLCIGGVGYLISMFKKQSKMTVTDMASSSTEIITFYKSENENLKIMMKAKDESNDEKFTALSKEIGEIRGQLIEKEKQNKQYLEILQNRDPETLQFQTAMIDFATSQSKINEGIVNTLRDIHEMTKAEHDRDFNATISVTKIS